ncbi:MULTISPECIES: hypothetical protein [unclassified Mesorhizobium]|uniref:hypothetical protein n=1 Tax=unclassified Mesorhizobium TaxID=325217 RepID=UPI001CCC9399|nr:MULTISPECIES: hypothetical protein [unclassified Mesorhizobium]MBZ9682173.1 hypothetical protein [Mesorhizobium sp. CO1-1-2]MBZ9925321.1 hypothetical protein [Mesorhizobium sp. BR1-1-4]
MSDSVNPWSIPFSRTSFLHKILLNHDNVENLRREKDILFLFERKQQGDHMRLLGGDDYAFSLALVMRALQDFGPLQYICVGGSWNGYSAQAKNYCETNHIGLYNSTELAGGVWATKYWDYAKKDKDGNRYYSIKS